MTFTQAVRSCLSQYAGFEGRAPRSEFWWFTLFYILVDVAVIAVGGMLLTGSITSVQGNVDRSVSWYVMTAPNWLMIIAHLALFLPTLAVTVRRLHDVGRTGWWILISFVPFFGILLLLFWWVQPSQREPNAYGPPLLPVR
ncbi:DUF805 domain-containing protein [Xanthobacter aminoxidans]|uniref:DUF805 domain-containing protein n=1 Tax=Xanthobacter aminoxidans TaxID=186280 RepID=UPI003727E85C